MYKFYVNLGVFNLWLMGFTVLFFILRRINKYVFHNKNALLRDISKKLDKLHPILGFILVITSFLHGYMIVGRIKFHSGYIAFFLILVQVVLGVLIRKMKRKSVVMFHRYLGILVVGMVAIHALLMNF